MNGNYYHCQLPLINKTADAHVSSNHLNSPILATAPPSLNGNHLNYRISSHKPDNTRVYSHMNAEIRSTMRWLFCMKLKWLDLSTIYESVSLMAISAPQSILSFSRDYRGRGR